VKPKTKSSYSYNVERYVIPRIGGVRLQDVRPLMITQLYAGLRVDGGRDGSELGWQSVQSIHRTLSTASNAAARMQLIHSNPAARAQLPPRPRAATREDREAEDLKVFSPGQLHEFLGAASEHRLGCLFHLAAYTGARRGELLHLRWSDVDLERGRVLVMGSRSLAGSEVVEGTPKSGRSRTVSIDPQTVLVLREHRARQAEERLAAGAVWEDRADYVFRSSTGEPVHPDTPSKLMKRLCAAAQVPWRRFHDLRHTHATILLSHGVPPHEVAERLGHADATITLKVYAKVLRERSNGLGDAFAAAMSGAG
jgi:integrase